MTAEFTCYPTKAELDHGRPQFVTSNPEAKMGLRRPPYAFTEQGVAMLSSVLRSKQAVAVNIEIMRTFVRLREMWSCNPFVERLQRNGDGGRSTQGAPPRQTRGGPGLRCITASR